MKRILLSINPEHVENILNGTKKYEFRKVKCKKAVNEIVIYSTAPVMKVVASVSVKKVIEGEPEKVWDITKDGAGIEKSHFDKYYEKSSCAVAYKLGKVKKFDVPVSLEEYGITRPPQSFMYLQSSKCSCQ